MFHGEGFYKWANGDTYRGEMKAGVMGGHGIMKDEKGVYIGQYEGGKRHGSGVQLSKSGDCYMSQFENDESSGLGIICMGSEKYLGK